MSTAASAASALAAAAELRVTLAGVDASIACDFAPFMEYAAVHLRPLRTGGAARPRIRARLHWHEGRPPNRARVYPELAQWNRVDRDLYRRDSRLAWFRIDDFPDLHLRFRVHDDELSIEGDYYHRLSKSERGDWMRRMLYRRALPTLRRRRFTTLLYYLIYYPCFWWLEREAAGHPIHAGGVELPGGVVVLAGPSGVGKSTLVAGLASAAQARLLSDTFLLQRGSELRAVPEPLLLDGWSRRWLQSDAEALRLVPHHYSLGRNGFHWPEEQCAAGGVARLLLFPQRAPRHYIEPLTPAQAQGRIRAGDLIVNDVRRYWAFAAALDVMRPKPLVQVREESLAALVAATPAFEIGLRADVSRAEIETRVGQLLAAQPASTESR